MTSGVLTDVDLKAIKDLIELTIEEKLDEKLETKLTEKLKYLPSKEDFFATMDEVMGELKKIREEQIALSDQVHRHDKILSVSQIS